MFHAKQERLRSSNFRDHPVSNGRLGHVMGNAAQDLGSFSPSRLMVLVETSADWRVGPLRSVNGYVGMASSGPVVRRSFASGPAAFFYLENVLQF